MFQGGEAVKTSMYLRLMRLITVSPFAVLVGVSGCGAGSGSAVPPVVNPPVGFAYVTAMAASAGGAGSVYEYAVLADGSVSPLAQVSVGAGVDPAAVALDQAGRHVYVVNVGDGTVSQYNIEANNSLAPMNPPAVFNPGMKTLGVMPSAVILDPSGSFLYVANSGDDTLSQFSIGSGGQLMPLAPATVPAGIEPVSIAVSVGPSGGHVYVANSGAGVPAGVGSVSQYSMGAGGTLTSLNPAAVSAGASPVAITIDQAMTPFGTAFVMSDCDGSLCTGSITQLALGAGGELTATGGVATTGSHYDAVGMVTDQSGANAYVLTNLMGVDTDNGALWQFSVGSTGALTAANQPMLSIGPAALAQTMHVDTLYVLTSNDGIGGNPGIGGSINCYTLGAGGLPTLAATTTLAAARPVSMAMLFLLAP
jgi:DNA-binding beta-propeller fold protein YncE